jgi:hypothetical protein
MDQNVHMDESVIFKNAAQWMSVIPKTRTYPLYLTSDIHSWVIKEHVCNYIGLHFIATKDGIGNDEL